MANSTGTLPRLAAERRDFHTIPVSPEIFLAPSRLPHFGRTPVGKIKLSMALEERELFVMYDVMIHCLQTGRFVATGIKTDEASFESLPEVSSILKACPACGSSHAWSKRSAMLMKGEEAA
jgi:hypothetical protein